jgi:hypothetical protein
MIHAIQISDVCLKPFSMTAAKIMCNRSARRGLLSTYPQCQRKALAPRRPGPDMGIAIWNFPRKL